jgi:hypothetical protein
VLVDPLGYAADLAAGFRASRFSALENTPQFPDNL